MIFTAYSVGKAALCHPYFEAHSMKLIAGHLNNELLESLHSSHTANATSIVVAVAYADNHFLGLLNEAAKHDVPVTFYGRYDEKMPVKLPVINWFLDRMHLKHMECMLVPDFYHPKIIWWKGRGAYIGSANLGHRAWFDNVEIGTFFTEKDLQEQGMHGELEAVVGRIRERAFTINDDLRKSMKLMADADSELDKAEEVHQKKFEKVRWIPKGKPLVGGTQYAASNKIRDYERTRHEILVLMGKLGDKLINPENRPGWMPADTPRFLQVDQFLYAYDEQFPKNGRSIKEIEAANALRHEDAVAEAIAWWRDGQYNAAEMRKQVETIYPLVRESFGRDRLLQLTQNDFVDAFTRIHAVQERARNRSNESLGMAKGQPAAERLRRHAEQIFKQESKGGKSVLQMLDYVLWGDSVASHNQRIYDGSNHATWAMPEIRVSTLSDIFGWVRPDSFPPINGRTVKALRLLGFQFEAGVETAYSEV